MQRVFNALWIFVISSVLHETCRAHECFQCRSDEHQHCADFKPPAIYRRPCHESSRGYCRKSTVMYYSAGENQPVIVRECANHRLDTATIEEGCDFGEYTRGSNSLTCECKGEGCNGTHLSNKRSVFSIHDHILVQIIIQLVLR